MIARGPLYQPDYRPLFSGHETFPLRYGWLKKAYDAVAASSDDPNNKTIFLADDAIARFGVGKNMVASIRHWATCCGVILEDASSGRLATTPLGDLLFGEGGVDPYLEHPTSLWLLHWKLCSAGSGRPIKTTWFWAFNHYSGSTFKREDLVDGLLKLADNRGWPRVSRTTVQRDVECFVRTYQAEPTGSHGAVEDALESPLAELGLIRGLKGHFQLIRGPKRSLSTILFAYALNEFWDRVGAPRSLSFEAIAYESGAPGRVFLLDEGDLADRLLALETLTSGVFRWSETAGLKQIFRDRSLTRDQEMKLVGRAYRTSLRPEAF